MPFLYSSPITNKNRCINIEDFLKSYDINKYTLILDTNICIYLENYFLDPLKTIDNWKKNNDLETLIDFFDMIKFINKFKISYNIDQALNESCRDIFNNYTLNISKFVKRVDCIEYILSDLPLSQVLYPTSNFQTDNNLDFLEEIMEPLFKSIDLPFITTNLIMSYICVLKIKQLADDRKQKNYEKLRSYFQFITKKLDFISLAHLGVAILIFGGFRLSNGKGMESLIHVKKKKKLSKRDSYIHGLWNAATDLAWVVNVCREIEYDKIPIFVTNDRALNEVMTRYIVNPNIKEHGNAPILAAFDYSNVKFDIEYEKELKKLEKELNTFQNKNLLHRRLKLLEGIENDTILNRFLTIKQELENYLPSH
ncbi:hypothetical protein J0801_27635 [Bacillus cereus]|uniref:hypothetical protein n=1 Tax=Bacillus cereus TaxID=1396 RepID=UPI002FDC0BC5|nr:hypothetical protein [Bacillus cereus]